MGAAPGSLTPCGVGGDTVPDPSNRAALLSVMLCECLKIIKSQTSSTPRFLTVDLLLPANVS